MVQFNRYYQMIFHDNYYPCIIQALVALYETAIYDHGNAPLRTETYKLTEYGITIDFWENLSAPRGTLQYATCVRTLQAVQLFAHTFGISGLSMDIFEFGELVGHAIIREDVEKAESG